MKLELAALLLLSLVLSSSLIQFTEAGDLAPAPSDDPNSCQSKCDVRCSKAGEWKRCFKDCEICCDACNCVPSGFYGNKSECPCYRDKLNSKGEPKCP